RDPRRHGRARLRPPAPALAAAPLPSPASTPRRGLASRRVAICGREGPVHITKGSEPPAPLRNALSSQPSANPQVTRSLRLVTKIALWTPKRYRPGITRGKTGARGRRRDALRGQASGPAPALPAHAADGRGRGGRAHRRPGAGRDHRA